MNRTIASAALATLLLASCVSSDDGTAPPALDTPAAIAAYLEGTSWLMTGADIPTHPNGFSQDVNFGPATQCYNAVSIDIAGGNWSTTSTLGTLNGAPNVGDTGTCDRNTVLTTLSPFTSTAVLVENVGGNGACFDLRVTYVGFAQEGRGKFSEDGRTMTLELFFSGQATGANCASGAVGSGGITLNAAPFTGDAQQVYRLQ